MSNDTELHAELKWLRECFYRAQRLAFYAEKNTLDGLSTKARRVITSLAEDFIEIAKRGITQEKHET